MSSLSVILASFGRCSQICGPETLVGISLKGPRNLESPPDFLSKVSNWLMPPASERWMTESARLNFWAAAAWARSCSAVPQPKEPKALTEPTHGAQRNP